MSISLLSRTPLSEGILFFFRKIELPMKYRHILAIAVLGTLSLGGKTTETVHRSYDEFKQGSMHGVSLHQQGILVPSGELSELAEIDAPILWDAVMGGDGALYIGSGNEGTVYKLDKSGELSVVLSPGMVMTRSLAVDRKGRVYAATSPKGSIYRIGKSDQVEEFLASPGDYIWDMALGPDGMLYLATGNQGRIYKVDPDAKTPEAELFYNCEETHITAIAFDEEGGLWAGSATHGLLIHIDGDGEGRVVYASGEREIRTLLPQADGSLYFSTFNNPGSKQGQQAAKSESESGSASGGQGGNAYFDEDNAPKEGKQSSEVESFFSMTVYADVEDGSTLYRLDPQGFPHRLWYHEGVSIYAAEELADGELLLGTGSDGLAFSYRGVDDWFRELDLDAGGEITAIVPHKDAGKYYLLCSNPGRVMLYDRERTAGGYYDSDVLDLGKTSLWGTLQLWAGGEQLKDVSCEVRVGNTATVDRSWTDWKVLSREGNLFENDAPPARYLKYRIRMESGEASSVHQVRVFSKVPNLAPSVHSLQVLESGFEAKSFFSSGPNLGVDLGRAMNESPAKVMEKMRSLPKQVKLFERPGAVTVIWRTYDPNDDTVEHSLYLESLAEDRWILLAEELEQGLFTFNTTGWKDGYYRLKAVVSDLPSNAPEDALSGEQTSQVFLIDNTPPVIEEKRVKERDGWLRIELSASDAASLIHRARLRWNGHEFQSVNPVDGILDSSKEDFVLRIPLEAGRERSVVFEVSDENGNLATYTYSVSEG